MTSSSASHRIRVALLVPSSNTVMENDLHAGLPKDRFTVHTDRMYLVETTRACELEMIEQHAPAAAKDLGTLKPDVLVFGCTSAGSLFGLAYDAKVCGSLGELAGCSTIGVVSSVSEALLRRKADKVAIITPYNEDLTQSVAAAVATHTGVVCAHGMGITDNVALADPTPEQIVEFARDRLRGQSFDCLFASCTNFRAVEALPLLEKAFGVPVVTSNSSVLEAIKLRYAA
jgi:maleate isomerase